MADVTLPALGESVEEGIVLAWLVEVGDTVEVDQPLLEISTDKIDTEIPSPVAGVLTEVRAEVDDTINVGQVIAVVDADASPSPKAATEPAEAPQEAEPAAEPEAKAGAKAEPAAKAPAPKQAPKPAATPAPAAPSAGSDANAGALVSPLVRKILREAGLNVDQVRGTGPGGRVLRADAEKAAATGGTAGTRQVAQVSAAPTTQRPDPSPIQIDFGDKEKVTQDLTRVRKLIAKGMHESLQNTAQLTAAVEVDVTRLMALRARAKDDFKGKYGASLSPFALLVRAALLAIENHPTVNSRIDVDLGTATWFRDVNLGVAVDAGDKGLIVPNVKAAQTQTVAELAQSIKDLAVKARGKGLKIDDMQNGTFTITNTGSLGTLFDTPILNTPEVAILATCAIEKRARVVTDEFGQDQIAVRWMTYLCLTYDHRQLDGADAARYLQDVKWLCENHDFSGEVA